VLPPGQAGGEHCAPGYGYVRDDETPKNLLEWCVALKPGLRLARRCFVSVCVDLFACAAAVSVWIVCESVSRAYASPGPHTRRSSTPAPILAATVSATAIRPTQSSQPQYAQPQYPQQPYAEPRSRIRSRIYLNRKARPRSRLTLPNWSSLSRPSRSIRCAAGADSGRVHLSGADGCCGPVVERDEGAGLRFTRPDCGRSRRAIQLGPSVKALTRFPRSWTC